MQAFNYKAVNETGRMVYGRVDAVNVGDLEMRLARMGLDLVNYRVLKTKDAATTGRGIQRVDLITFCFHLEQLTRAGVPILEGLADLRDSVESPRLREVASAIIEAIEGGKNLSGAMAEFPRVFDGVFVSLIRAGEESGRLPEVLAHIVENLKWQDEQTAHTKKLFIYPALVTTVVMAAVVFLMVGVVPQLLRFIKTMGGEIPLQTRMLMAVSGFMVDYWYVVLMLPALAIGISYVGVRTNPAIRLWFDDLKLRIPVFGPILQKIILTRFANYFAIMYASGITVLDCIRVSEDIVGNEAVAQALRGAGRDIADGSGITTAFERTRLFPRLVLRMLRVGESTGALEQALQNVNYFYTRDVRESIDRLQSLIGPALTVTVGLLLLWVMSSVLSPIYDLISKIKI
ncbi:MAG: type II secretion system F family protein [Gammaproteobacteria bacterium]